MNKHKKFRDAIGSTKILRLPRHGIATFGVTNIHYHMLTELDETDKVRVREGMVISERPKLLAARELKEIFEGFNEESKEFADMIFQEVGSDLRMLEYRFRNELKNVRTETAPLKELADKITGSMEKSEERLSAIISGSEDSWQISLMKFIVEMTRKSFYDNVTELNEKGFFEDETGLDRKKKEEVNRLFYEARKDKSRVGRLGEKLKEYGLFEKYQDSFFGLLK